MKKTNYLLFRFILTLYKNVNTYEFSSKFLLMYNSVIMTHASVPAEERAKLGISDNLCRLSIGVEDIEDILADLKNALDAVKL